MRLLATYGRVLAELRPEKWTVIAMTFANVLLAVVQFADPILFGHIVDALSRARRSVPPLTFRGLLPLVVPWVAFGLFNIGAGVLVALHADRLAHRCRASVMARFFQHVLSLPAAFHANSHSSRLMKVMLGGADSMSFVWLGFFREHCSAFVALVVLLPLTVLKNAQLGSLLVALVVVFAALTTLVIGRTQALQGKVTAHHTALAEHAADTIGNLPIVQSFTRIEDELGELKEITLRLLEAQLPVLSWWAVAAVATRAAATLTMTAILLVGTWLFLHGQASVGEVVAFLSIAGMLVGRLGTTIGFITSLFHEAPKMSEFFEILDTTPSLRDRPDAVDAGTLSARITFERVSFSYDGVGFALRDVSFDVEPGETVAFVGPTGSGKSTTLGLLHRAFDPTEGRILADGRDIREFSLYSLRRNIGIVFQESMLFARSIRDNLIVGKPDATDDEIFGALERAQALDVVERAPHGLDTIIGERGRSLSGGECQRLSIARALLKDPPILILDEATSALDAQTEQKIKRALDEVVKGRTTFVIAHRLATVKDATKIFVFDHGTVVECGGFSELVRADGRFAALARAQALFGEAG